MVNETRSLMFVPAVESYHSVVGWPDQTLGECSFEPFYGDAGRQRLTPPAFYRTDHIQCTPDCAGFVPSLTAHARLSLDEIMGGGESCWLILEVESALVGMHVSTRTLAHCWQKRPLIPAGELRPRSVPVLQR